MTSICDFSGISYVASAIDVNALINERVRAFAERTRCLYDDAVTFTLAASTSVYSYRSSGVFSRDLIEVDRVYISRNPLSNFQGKFGPISLDELVYNFPTYLTDGTGIPSHFCQIAPHSLRLYPTPASAYVNCFVSGWYMPSNITTSTSGDSTEIGLPEEYQRTAAYFTASALLFPTSTGDIDYQKLAQLNQEAGTQMLELTNRSKRFVGGPSLRGSIRFGF